MYLKVLQLLFQLKLHEIQFEGQTKAKLGSMEAQTAVAGVFSDAFNDF